MAILTSDILDVLSAYGIRPFEDELGEIDIPGIGEIGEAETVYSTSLDEVFPRDDGELPGRPSWPGILDTDDPRIQDWWRQIENLIDQPGRAAAVRSRREPPGMPAEPPEPHCAWYCPIHFFGLSWGIYIRENCLLSHATEIAAMVHWPSVHAHKLQIAQHLLRSAFYSLFLHEQFHHKVESLGFRLLIATGRDRYRPYKANVYRPTVLTRHCIEESLANAESVRRLGENRYVKRVDPAIRDGLRRYLKNTISMQPPGYAEGIHYLGESAYRRGLFNLQSQVLDGKVLPSTIPNHWSIAPNMITALADITEDIYIILPAGARPIFRPTSVDPGATVSSRALEGALTRHYGYRYAPGGKGSHVKLKKAGAPTIVLPGNRAVLTPGVVKEALRAFGDYPLSRLPDLLDGKLGMSG